MAKTNENQTPETGSDENQTPETAPAKPRFQRLAVAALPTYSLENIKQGVPFYIKLQGEMFTREQLDKDDKPKLDPETKKPLMITTVPMVDLETGQEGTMVCPFIIKKAFDEIAAKHDGSVTGLCFEIIRGRKVNRTYEYAVYQIADPNA